MIEDIAAYLADQLGLQIGQNLFIGFLPDGPTNATAIYEYQGQAPSQEQGTGRIIEERLSLQFKFRGDDYQEVSLRANQALHALCSEDSGFEIHPMQSPFSLGWSSGICEFAFNARIRRNGRINKA